MLHSTGRILNLRINTEPNNLLSKQAFYNGILRYAQVSIIMGMSADFRGCHSRFLVDYSSHSSLTQYHKSAEFIFNHAGDNLAAEKIDYLIAHPDIPFTTTPNIGETREVWPGAIRIPYLSTDDHITDEEIILSNSGVPDDMDVILVAAFAKGINEIDPRFSLDNFHENNQYAWGFKRAKRFIFLATELDAVFLDVVEDSDWKDWAMHL
jgi:hypothetical protein